MDVFWFGVRVARVKVLVEGLVVWCRVCCVVLLNLPALRVAQATAFGLLAWNNLWLRDEETIDISGYSVIFGWLGITRETCFVFWINLFGLLRNREKEFPNRTFNNQPEFVAVVTWYSLYFPPTLFIFISNFGISLVFQYFFLAP